LVPFYLQGNDISRSSSCREAGDAKTAPAQKADSLAPIPRRREMKEARETRLSKQTVWRRRHPPPNSGVD